MSNVRYLLKDGKLFADFSNRKEARWEERQVPSQCEILTGSKALRIISVLSAPTTVVYNESVPTGSITLLVEFDNEAILEKHPDSVECDTSVLGDTPCKAIYDTLNTTFSIEVVAPPEPPAEEPPSEEPVI